MATIVQCTIVRSAACGAVVISTYRDSRTVPMAVVVPAQSVSRTMLPVAAVLLCVIGQASVFC